MKQRPSKYKQLSIRIGSGKTAADYLARIDQAMRAARRKTRADWCKFAIDIALENAGFPPADTQGHTADTQRSTQRANGGARRVVIRGRAADAVSARANPRLVPV
jgi:hypothetical protein